MEKANSEELSSKIVEKASRILFCTNQLKALLQSNEKKSLELEVKEKKLQSLSLDLEKRRQIFEKEKKEAGNLKILVEECTQELRSKRNQLTVKLDLLTRTQRELESKEEQLKNVMAEIKRRCSELDDRKKEVEDKIEKRKNELALIFDKIKQSSKQFKATKIESSDWNARSGKFKQGIQGRERELDNLKNQVESEEKKLIQMNRDMEEVTHRKEKILEVIQSKIQESSKQLVVVNEKLESQQKLLETQLVELVSRDMELECVAESSKQFKFDLEVKEKRLHVLTNLVTISSEQLDLKSKELGEVQKLIEVQTKKLSDMQKKKPSATSITDSSQQIVAEADLVNEDALLQHESSASLVHSELSIALKASPNPAELVLDLVQEFISKESALVDSVVEILVLLLDELAKFQEPEQSQLQLRATEVATLWKGKITIKAPKSSLEALAFLMFIVAYGLKKMINQEETVLLASSIAQYRQAPALFNSLGLKSGMIPEIVNELIKRSQYIAAVGLICHYKLTRSFSPSYLLMKEITNLRGSILEKRPTGSFQAKDKDAGRLRDILELVAHYELKIDLPGDLVAKLMVQRENSNPLVRCSVTHFTSSSSPQANTPAQQSGVKLRVPKPEV